MKKFYLFTLGMLSAISGFSQGNTLQFPVVTAQETQAERPNANSSVQRGGVFWTENFANGLNSSNGTWTQSGTDQIWKHSFYPSSGEWSTGTPQFASTTAANGYMLFDADSVNFPVSPNYVDRDGMLISPSINCSGQATVLLTFEQNVRWCCTQLFLNVGVSNNGGSTWTDYDVLNGLAANVASPNPELVQLDISSVAANQSNVMIRFSFGGVSHYYWVIDDISLESVTVPVADFNANQTTIVAGNSVNFTDLSTGSPNSWNWSFPGAATTSSTQQNPTNITYNNAGCYDVTLSITGPGGSDSETKVCYIDVTAAPQPPVADFSGSPTTIEVGQSVNFTDLSTNTPTSWSWSFPGAATTSSTQQNPTGITYNTVGCFDVSLTATNAQGNDTESKTCYIDVTCPTFDVGFAYTATGLSVQFTNLSYNVESYDWNFGDGNTSIAPDPINNYASAGTYTVTLQGFDTDCTGNSDLAAYNITVDDTSNSSNVGIEDIISPIYNLNVYPNPTTGLFTLDFDVNNTEDVQVRILDMIGKEVEFKQFNRVQGAFTTVMDLTGLAQGTYMLQVMVGNTSQMKRIILK